ncbi:MAG: hypothetical protein ACM33T_02050 [Solirubrobacterales bacterium]
MRRFIGTFFAGLAGMVVLGAGINLAVDPYGVFGTPLVEGFNREKPQGEAQPYLAKTYLVERAQPKTLLVGNSRIQSGLDPESEAWPADARPVFNFGIGGANLYANYRLLQHSLAVSTPSLVVIGLAVEDTLDVARTTEDYQPRLRVDAGGGPNRELWRARAQDAAFALLSLTALGDSLITVWQQGRPGVSKMTPLGFNDGGGMTAAAEAEGYHSLFKAKERKKAEVALRWARHPGYDLKPLRDMIRLSLDHGARVVVFLSPGHVGELEIYRRNGLTDAHLHWKDEVTAMVKQFADDGAKVALWDFGGVSRYTSETVPPVGDRRTPMAWFWEINHFKPALGRLIIARMMGHGPADLGVELTASGVVPKGAQACGLGSGFAQPVADTDGKDCR